MKAGAASGTKAKLAAQHGVLGLERQRRRLPAVQPGILLAQPGILAAHRQQSLGLPHRVAHGRHRLLQHRPDRRQRIRQDHPCPLGQQRIRLAEQHRAERQGDQQRQGQARQGLSQRHAQSDHAGSRGLN
ncbi:hypothetical protein [Dankookia sp. P2]|uniref:hypothetical protein n=1 Tax=Dankookia sp. P2 TaxID=3423955 RepID=UPI003D67D2F3